jgi:DNA-binding transcriptional LysR family regulator
MTALLDIDQLRTFIAIAETGSFTRAADVVHKTQSAVSMQMKRLEERLGKPIFERDGRASKLTDDGERLLDYARRIVKLNLEAFTSVAGAGLSGSARLGVPDDYADRYLPEIMARFARSHPGVELTIVCEPTVSLVDRIDNGDIDLAIITHSSSNRHCDIIRRERLLWSHRAGARFISKRWCRSRSAARPAPGAGSRSRSCRAPAARTASSIRAGTPARSAPRCSRASRYPYSLNPRFAPACG